ncbi:MAG: HAD hydrolase family protein [Methanomicrobiales archaeon]|nr:HAD hydrolase family protein [Methanomicrobiales archaeon]
MDKPKEKLKGIRLLALDFDGVFTDNRVFVDDTGREMVICDRADSLGLKLLRERRPDIRVFVISKETSGVVKGRCDKLKIPALTGIDDKPKAFRELMEREGVAPGETAFVGNDLNDVECIRMAGVGISPADGVREARRAADLVTRHRGGQGAIREVTEIILGIDLRRGGRRKGA